MSLELRPTCENCSKSLPPEAPDAMICTFECTFCAECVENILFNVCPNCDGGFTPRPVRPKKHLAKNPASSKVIHFPVDVDKHADAIKKFKSIPPEER